MAISIFFSLIIYKGATFELQRIETNQAQRRPVMGAPPILDPEVIDETKRRIALSLFATNIVILGLSATAGYFLAGKTLEPIKKNIEEQKEFIGNASHELRTPQTALKTEIEVGLRDEKLTLAVAKRILVSNLEEVNKMQKLSDYLLKLNRFETGKKVFEMSKVDLKKVAIKAIGKRNVKRDLKKSLVVGNEDALSELVGILLDNAFKYSPKNKNVSVKVKDKQIEVSDRGIGIPKNDLPYIFDRFYRSDKSRTQDGYGLGLSIAKQIADLHGAKIKVESKLGVGSTFKVIFS
jgi:signal transduction histidine kinase